MTEEKDPPFTITTVELKTPKVVPVHELARARAVKAGDGRMWSPLDCLKTLVAEVESGKINPNEIIVVWREMLPGKSLESTNPGEKVSQINYQTAGLDRPKHLSLLEQHKYFFMRAWAGDGEE